MRKLILIATVLAAAACSKKSPPAIQSFSADKSEISAGDSVSISFVVTGATRITLNPDPGVVTASPVVVTPALTTTYTLRAENDAGAVSQDLLVTVKPVVAPARIASFNAVPAQVAAGSPVTLTWSVSNATSIKISDGSANPPVDVSAATTKVVTPSATTTYTMTATGLAGTSPPSVTATAMARVAAPAHISSFAASQSAINQGQATTLTWDGNASSWSLFDGATTTNYGPLKTATVRPAANTTYTLTATGIGGNDTKPLSITVTPQPGTTLVYTAPVNPTQALQLVADPCSPCTSITLHLVATGTTSLRGVALNLPLDSSKVSLDPTSLVVNASVITAPAAFPTPAAKAILGSGPLKDTLVLGAASKGSASGVAADSQLFVTTEVAHFVLGLIAAGGKGVVFDGSTPATNAAITSRIQSASGAALGAIAVGTLEVQ